MKYEEVKRELARLVSSTRFFNREFYRIYLECLKKTRENVEKDVDDSFQLAPGVFGFRSWEPVYNSRFYRENSGAYCEFLSVVHGRV